MFVKQGYAKRVPSNVKAPQNNPPTRHRGGRGAIIYLTPKMKKKRMKVGAGRGLYMARSRNAMQSAGSPTMLRAHATTARTFEAETTRQLRGKVLMSSGDPY